MKSKIIKEWYLIFLIIALTIYSQDAILSFISYLPRSSGYKHAMAIWGLEIARILFPIVVWFMIFTKHPKLLSALNLLLMSVVLIYVIPLLYYAVSNLNDNAYHNEGFIMLIKSLIYLFIIVLLFLFGNKYITKTDSFNSN